MWLKLNPIYQVAHWGLWSPNWGLGCSCRGLWLWLECSWGGHEHNTCSMAFVCSPHICQAVFSPSWCVLVFTGWDFSWFRGRNKRWVWCRGWVLLGDWRDAVTHRTARTLQKVSRAPKGAAGWSPSISEDRRDQQQEAVIIFRHWLGYWTWKEQSVASSRRISVTILQSWWISQFCHASFLGFSLGSLLLLTIPVSMANTGCPV